MLIAVVADGPELSSPVSKNFAACACVLFVETDTMSFEAIGNSGEPDGTKLAQMIVDRNCEAVIMGEILPPAFNILALEGVTRYSGFGCDAKTALQRMDENALEYICDIDGNDPFAGEHHSCGGEHDACDGCCEECE